MTAGRPGAVMLLTAWVDEGALRVRATAGDPGGPTRPVGVAGDVDGACDLVRTWLQEIAAPTAVAAAGDGDRDRGVDVPDSG